MFKTFSQAIMKLLYFNNTNYQELWVELSEKFLGQEKLQTFG